MQLVKDKYDHAAEVRQKILDYLNTVESSTSSPIAEKLGLGLDHAYRSLIKMESQGEVNKTGRSRQLTFTANATVTHSAQFLRENAFHRQTKFLCADSLEEKEREEKRKKSKPGHYVHVPHTLVGNHGGQGAVRHTSWGRAEGSVS